MATVSKYWGTAAVLAATDAFGGAVADLAADQAYDYTSDVDLETTGYLGAQVLVEAKLNFGERTSIGAPAVQNDLHIDVFASLDGTTYDTVAYQSYTMKRIDSDWIRMTFLVEELAHFRIGLKTSGTDDTYDYRITYQPWRLTNA